MTKFSIFVYSIYISIFIIFMLVLSGGYLNHNHRKNPSIIFGGDVYWSYDILDSKRSGASAKVIIDSCASNQMSNYIKKLSDRNVVCLVPSEQFFIESLTESIKSESTVSAKLLPLQRENKLVLVMSRWSLERLQARVASRNGVEDWIAACTSTRDAEKPIRFYMTDPNVSSSSWLALASLANESGLGEREMSSYFEKLKKNVIIEDTSARVEVYRFFLKDCPDGVVILTYKHLTDDFIGMKGRGEFVVVEPATKMRFFMRPLVASRRADDVQAYESFFAKELRKYGFEDAKKFSAPKRDEITPTYNEMMRLLAAWNSGR